MLITINAIGCGAGLTFLNNLGEEASFVLQAVNIINLLPGLS